MTFDPFDPQPDYSEDEGVFLPQLAALMAAPPPWDAAPDTAEETYRLALESCQRWLNNYRLSPAMRLRALRSVVQSALSDATQ